VARIADRPTNSYYFYPLAQCFSTISSVIFRHLLANGGTPGWQKTTAVMGAKPIFRETTHAHGHGRGRTATLLSSLARSSHSITRGGDAKCLATHASQQLQYSEWRWSS